MRDERIRVLAFLTVFDIGGTERQVLSLAQGLDPSRFDLHLACLKRSGAFLAELEARKVPIVEYPINSLYKCHTLREQIRFAAYLRLRGIQIVHAYGFYPNVFAIPAARLAGVPAVIGSLRDMGDHWTPLQRRAQRWACRMAHRIVANAEAVKERALAEGYDPGRLRVIRNGLDLAKFGRRGDGAAARAGLGLPSGAPVVAVVSRLNDSIKGVDHFLAAAAQIAATHSDVRFLVVGDGPLRRQLEEQAERLGLAGRALFTGFRLDVAEMMSVATVSVIPSLSEGLSNVLLESMAAGLPVVATRVGGTPEVVEDGRTGLLVPSGDPSALAEAIRAFLGSPGWAEACGRAGRDRALSFFSLSRMVTETEELYRDLIPEGGRRAAAHPTGLTLPAGASGDSRRRGAA